MDLLAGFMVWLESLGRMEITDTERDTKACHIYCNQVEYEIQKRTHRQWTEVPNDGHPNEMLNEGIGI